MTPVDRRQFTAMLASVGLSSDSRAFAGGETLKPEILRLSRNGWMPNNERLPVLLYHSAIDLTGSDPAALFDAFSSAMAGRRNGGMGSSIFTITIPLRTRCWDLRQVKPA